MSETADAVIVGAGVMGVSTAYQLARRGYGKIVVLDRGAVGSGSTGQSGGGIRHQFSDPTAIELTRLSMRVFERFDEEFGVELPFHRCGYLYVLQTEQQVAAFRRNVEMQQGLGLDVRLLTPEETARQFPYLYTGDLLAASYSPDDGYSDPSLCTTAMAARARELGVEIRTDQEVVAITRSGDRVAGATTARTELAAPTVLIAAGPWSGEVGKLAGIEVPVVPRRREVFGVDSVGLETVPETPYILDPHGGFSLHREDEVVEFGTTLPLAPTFDVEPNPGAAPDLAARVSRRCPALANAPVTRARAGLLEVTPDHNGIIGAVPTVDGLYVLAGFSGHGFMHAPIAGQLMAELIADGRAHTVDVTSFGLDRFGRGEAKVDATSPFH